MISDAIEAIEDLKSQALEPREVAAPDESQAIFVVNGELQRFPIRRARNHTVRRVESLIAAAKKWGDEGAIFHNDGQATLICKVDSEGRIDRVVLPLKQTDKCERINELCDGERRWFSQAEFVRLLRIDLAGVFPKQLLAQVRQVQVTGQGAKGGDIQHGRERGVSEFQKELAKADQFPEELPAVFNYYTCPDLHSQVTVRAALEIDLDRVAFAIAFDPDELTAVHDQVQEGLHDMLEAAAGCPIFYGAP